MNPATTADVAARWRPLSPDEVATAQARLDDAWELVLHRVPSVEERLADGSLRSGLVIQVLCEMVLRVLRNPEGLRSETTSVDDYSHTRTRDTGLASGALSISDEEVALLMPAREAGAFTIRPYGAPDYVCPPEWS